MKNGILKCKIYIYNLQVDQDFESGGRFKLPSLEIGTTPTQMKYYTIFRF